MAEALIAKAKGDMTTAFAKMQQRYTSIVQGILTYNNSSTAKQLAALENSKSRQAERESALKREAELKQQKLDQQKRVNFLLIILVGLLALAALAALIFARAPHAAKRHCRPSRLIIHASTNRRSSS